MLEEKEISVKKTLTDEKNVKPSLVAVEKIVNVEFTSNVDSLNAINTLIEVINMRVAYPQFEQDPKKAKINPIKSSIELSPLTNQQVDVIHSKIIDLINKL